MVPVKLRLLNGRELLEKRVDRSMRPTALWRKTVNFLFGDRRCDEVDTALL
jgi:hypothetical protein